MAYAWFKSRFEFSLDMTAYRVAFTGPPRLTPKTYYYSPDAGIYCPFGALPTSESCRCCFYFSLFATCVEVVVVLVIIDPSE